MDERDRVYQEAGRTVQAVINAARAEGIDPADCLTEGMWRHVIFRRLYRSGVHMSDAVMCAVWRLCHRSWDAAWQARDDAIGIGAMPDEPDAAEMARRFRLAAEGIESERTGARSTVQILGEIRDALHDINGALGALDVTLGALVETV